VPGTRRRWHRSSPKTASRVHPPSEPGRPELHTCIPLCATTLPHVARGRPSATAATADRIRVDRPPTIRRVPNGNALGCIRLPTSRYRPESTAAASRAISTSRFPGSAARSAHQSYISSTPKPGGISRQVAGCAGLRPHRRVHLHRGHISDEDRRRPDDQHHFPK
jgi:hypothetical protein